MISNPFKNKQRKRFGLDLDGVVFAFDIGACIALKLRGVDIEVRESYHWNDIAERISPEAWKWLWNEGVRECFANAPVYPGVIKHLHVIQDLMDIVVITHRPRSVVDITLKKLAEQGLRPIAVHHVQGQDKTKVDPTCIAYVDDKPENVTELATAHDVPVFMPRKPWNRELHWPDQEGPLDIRPYDDFKEVERWVRQHA